MSALAAITRTHVAVLVATAANALGWALPVIEEVRGWQAFRVALSPIWPFEQFRIEESHLVVLSVSSALTNALFVVVALLLLKAASVRGAQVCLWLAAAATLLNLHWTVTMEENAADLEVGYYVWVVSFALLALSAFLRIQSLRAARPR